MEYKAATDSKPRKDSKPADRTYGGDTKGNSTEKEQHPCKNSLPS